MNENQVGVILERVEDMFKTLAEGQKIMEKDISELKQKVERMDRKLDSVVTYTAQVAEKVTDHEIRITVLERR